MFGVNPFPSSPTGEWGVGQLESRTGKDRTKAVIETGPKVGKLIEHLVDEASHSVEPGLHPAMALPGAGAEPLGPGRGVSPVVAGLEQGLGGNASEHRVGRRTKPFPKPDLIAVDEELAGDGLAEIAVGLLADQQVGKLALVAGHRQVVLGSALPLQLAVTGEQCPGDTQMIEGNVAESEVELEVGSRGDPTRKLLGQDQVVVGVSEDGAYIAHIWPTSSGMS